MSTYVQGGESREVTYDAHSPELCAGAINGHHWMELYATGQQAALTLGAATREMAGLYRCSADNGVGPPLLKHINVIVQGPYPACQHLRIDFLPAGPSLKKFASIFRACTTGGGPEQSVMFSVFRIARGLCAGVRGARRPAAHAALDSPGASSRLYHIQVFM